jgi:hypothetical protein
VTQTTTMEVPGYDMVWYVRLNAPYGGTSGQVSVLHPLTGVKSAMDQWSYCEAGAYTRPLFGST